MKTPRLRAAGEFCITSPPTRMCLFSTFDKFALFPITKNSVFDSFSFNLPKRILLDMDLIASSRVWRAEVISDSYLGLAAFQSCESSA